MKKLLIMALSLVLLLTVAILASLLFSARGLPKVELTDGTEARIVDVYLGEYHQPNISTGLLMRASRVLPKNLNQRLSALLPASTVSGSGRGWMWIPDETNTLNVWVQVQPWSEAAATQPSHLEATITDADGWIWESYSHAYASRKDWGTNNIEYRGFGFGRFPRWQQYLDVKMRVGNGHDSTSEPLGTVRILNPAFEQEPVKWEVKPLPQSAFTGTLEVVLDSIRFNSSPRGALAGADRLVPFVNLTLHSIEPSTSGPISNAWHKVETSFYDNYGNSSYEGLPPLRPTDTNAPSIQWKIGTLLVGDQHSESASNIFLTIPTAALPSAGMLQKLDLTEQHIFDLKFHSIAVIGSGITKVRGSRIITNYSSDVASQDWVQTSSATTSDASGRRVITCTYSSASPMVAVACEGPTKDLWISCRAQAEDTGQVFWLSESGQPSSQNPAFHRIYNNTNFLVFSCKDLSTNQAWQFTFGAHAPRNVEFYLDRPSWTPKDSPSQ